MANPKEVVVVGVDMPFLAMVWLIIKWSLAAIPAGIIMSILVAVSWGIVAGFAAAIVAAIGAAT